MAFTNFGKRFFIYIQAVSQCHSCFPFFVFFCRMQSPNKFALYRYTVLCILLSPCRWCSDNSVNREKEQFPLFTNTCREWDKRVNSMSGFRNRRHSSLLTFCQVLRFCGAQSWAHPRVAASSFLHKRVLVNQWLYDNNVNALAIQRQITPGQTQD